MLAAALCVRAITRVIDARSLIVLSQELERLDSLRQRGVLSEEEFARAKARLLDNGPPPALSALGRLRRSLSDRWIGGVCGGLAQTLGIESWILRLSFALLFFFGGAGIVLYLLLWVFVPVEQGS